MTLRPILTPTEELLGSINPRRLDASIVGFLHAKEGGCMNACHRFDEAQVEDALPRLLRAERRVVVDRIRERLDGTVSRYHESHYVKAEVLAILKEEAS